MLISVSPLFENSYLNIVTITFSSLILTEFLNIYSEVNFILIFIIKINFYLILKHYNIK
jgi:hypothetical protein